jgi:hypothetical protein
LASSLMSPGDRRIRGTTDFDTLSSFVIRPS